MTTRRDLMTTSARLASLMAAAGLLPTAAQAQWNKGAFEAKSMADVAKAFGGATPVANAGVSVSGPDIAENGAVVPVGAACSLPGVRRLMVLVDKNPNALAAVFDVSEAVDASFNTRVKMGQSSDVYAVAQMADGRFLFAQKEIKVTLGGCGG